MRRRTPAQIYALAVGASLLLAGVLGFFWETSFSVGAAVDRPENRDDLLGIFDVNGWHNVVHLMSGVVGLIVARSWTAARSYALAFGLVYAVVAIAGFAAGDGGVLLGLLPVNTADNLLHVALGTGGILAGLASPAVPQPTTRLRAS